MSVEAYPSIFLLLIRPWKKNLVGGQKQTNGGSRRSWRSAEELRRLITRRARNSVQRCEEMLLPSFFKIEEDMHLFSLSLSLFFSFFLFLSLFLSLSRTHTFLFPSLLPLHLSLSSRRQLLEEKKKQAAEARKVALERAREETQRKIRYLEKFGV